MNKQAIFNSVAKCREKIARGISRDGGMDDVRAGLFGLRIIEIMLSDPISELEPILTGPEVHVISFGFGNMGEPETTDTKKPHGIGGAGDVGSSLPE